MADRKKGESEINLGTPTLYSKKIAFHLGTPKNAKLGSQLFYYVNKYLRLDSPDPGGVGALLEMPNVKRVSAPRREASS